MKKSVHLLFAVTMLFIFGLADSTNACEEECPACQVWDDDAGEDGACVNDCESGEICCDGDCMDCSGVCCNDSCCESGVCCGDTCCSEDQSCNTNEDCICDDSDEEPQELASYNYDASGLLSGIESAINSVPKLEASDFSLEFDVTATKENKCCSPDDLNFTEELKVEGSGSLSGAILVDIFGTKDFSFEKTWPGYGSVSADFNLDIGPEFDLSASGSVSGAISGCGPCLSAGGNAGITITLTVTGSGNVTVTCEETWFWDEFDMTVAFGASGSASVSAEAGGTYYDGDGCEDEGFVTGCCQIGHLEVHATLEFEVGPWSYEVDSGDIELWEGWNNGKC